MKNFKRILMGSVVGVSLVALQQGFTALRAPDGRLVFNDAGVVQGNIKPYLGQLLNAGWSQAQVDELARIFKNPTAVLAFLQRPGNADLPGNLLGRPHVAASTLQRNVRQYLARKKMLRTKTSKLQKEINQLKIGKVSKRHIDSVYTQIRNDLDGWSRYVYGENFNPDEIVLDMDYLGQIRQSIKALYRYLDEHFGAADPVTKEYDPKLNALITRCDSLSNELTQRLHNLPIDKSRQQALEKKHILGRYAAIKELDEQRRSESPDPSSSGAI